MNKTENSPCEQEQTNLHDYADTNAGGFERFTTGTETLGFKCDDCRKIHAVRTDAQRCCGGGEQ